LIKTWKHLCVALADGVVLISPWLGFPKEEWNYTILAKFPFWHLTWFLIRWFVMCISFMGITTLLLLLDLPLQQQVVRVLDQISYLERFMSSIVFASNTQLYFDLNLSTRDFAILVVFWLVLL